MKRVVITGVGMVTPYGVGLHRFEQGVRAHQSVFAPITVCDTSGSRMTVAGQCEDLDEAPLKVRKIKKLVNRKDHLALAAAQDAWVHAKLEQGQFDPSRAGAYVGTCSTQIGDFFPYFDQVLACVSEDRSHFNSSELGRSVLQGVNPIAALRVLSNGALAHLAQTYNLQGPNTNILNFGTAGLEAVQQGAYAIAHDQADICMAGAMYAPLDPFQLADGVNQEEWCAPVDGAGTGSGSYVQPYATHPRGTLPTEASVFFVLESLEHARTRSAAVYGEIKAWSQGAAGASSDGRALRVALSKLPVRPDQALGCGHGHRTIDKWELDTLNATCSVHSIYSFFGYPGEASGLVQIAAGLICYRNGALETPQGKLTSDDALLISTMNRFGGAATAIINAIE